VRQQNERPLPPSTYNDDVPEALGAAVLRALEGDPARRYTSASEMSGGLQLGLQGEDVTLPLGEGTAATNVLGSETATRHLDQTAQTEYRPAPSPTRRPVARAPQPPPVAPRPAQPQQKRSAFSRFARFVMALVALVLIAAAVAAGVIYTTDKATGVKVKEVTGDTIEKVVDEIDGLLEKNTE
jgi:serine/threonine-protein kinase